VEPTHLTIELGTAAGEQLVVQVWPVRGQRRSGADDQVSRQAVALRHR